MRFTELPIAGAYMIEPESKEDERGFFARTFSFDEFKAKGLVTDFLECSVAYNKAKSTLRGMHWQTGAYAETKLIRCTRGSVYDVIADVRPESKTYKKWIAHRLSGKNHLMLYVPPGLAHGLLTLEDDSEMFYQITPRHNPESARGFKWDDKAFDIEWPIESPLIVSERDRTFPDWKAN